MHHSSSLLLTVLLSPFLFSLLLFTRGGHCALLVPNAPNATNERSNSELTSEGSGEDLYWVKSIGGSVAKGAPTRRTRNVIVYGNNNNCVILPIGDIEFLGAALESVDLDVKPLEKLTLRKPSVNPLNLTKSLRQKEVPKSNMSESTIQEKCTITSNGSTHRDTPRPSAAQRENRNLPPKKEDPGCVIC